MDLVAFAESPLHAKVTGYVASVDIDKGDWVKGGQVLALTALLARNPHPSDEEIDRGMAGNLCRCGAYPKIRAAARALARQGTPPAS